MPTTAGLLLQFLPGLVALAAAVACQIEAARNLRTTQRHLAEARHHRHRAEAAQREAAKNTARVLAALDRIKELRRA